MGAGPVARAHEANHDRGLIGVYVSSPAQPPPLMGSGPWPTCCGRPMWFGPYGYGCESCRPAAEQVVELPEPLGEQLALFRPERAA